MIFNKSTTHSIRILNYLDHRDSDNYLSAGEISSALHLPKEYVSKILQKLTKAKVVNSRKGKGGGFRLPENQNQIKIKKLIRIFENPGFFTKCIIGCSNNSEECKCTFHLLWTDFISNIVSTKLEEIRCNIITE